MILKRQNNKFVLELSSSAVKRITKTSRDQVRTNTKFLVDSRGNMDLRKFQESIIPVIKQYWGNGKGGICIATGIFRKIKNIDEVLDLIREETGIKVNIISGEEEARLIAKAIEKEHQGERIIILDAGGSSAEVVIPFLNYYKSFDIGKMKIDKKIREQLKKDNDLLIVVTGQMIYKMGKIITDPEISLKWHDGVQDLIKQIGIHPVVGTIATPGLGLLLN